MNPQPGSQERAGEQRVTALIKRLDARVVHVARAAFVLTVACATGPVLAAPSFSGILGCRGITDAAARLACFDRESAQVAAETSSPPSQTPPTTPSAAEAVPSLDPKHTFGLSSAEVSAREEAAGKRPHPVESITAHIARFSGSGNARMVFRLDNDQVWEQLLSEGDLNASPGDEVEISRGVLGSYWLKDKATGRGCKVRRLR